MCPCNKISEYVCSLALGSTQPLTEMSTRNIFWGGGGGVKAAGAYGWQPTTFICRLSRNLGASTSWNPLGLSRPVMGLPYLTSILRNIPSFPLVDRLYFYGEIFCLHIRGTIFLHTINRRHFHTQRFSLQEYIHFSPCTPSFSNTGIVNCGLTFC
jgi:hypothetical protein